MIAMPDPSPSWSASARRLTVWTWQQANAKRYADFMMFFSSNSSGATEATDSTMKLHPSKLMVKNSMKSKLSGSIMSFVENCSIW